MRVLAVPTISMVVGKEAPRELIIPILHENANTVHLARLIAHILLPNN